MSTRDFTPTRRGFLQVGAAGAALAGFAQSARAQEPEPIRLEDYAPQVFDAAEWAFLVAATARLIPSEGVGPGALETNVPVFIDRELAGPYGEAADWYMEGPFEPEAAAELGWQTPLTPRQIYKQGIAHVNETLAGEGLPNFAELPPEDQDRVLTGLENGDLPMPPELRGFFDLLLQNTKEGYFCDPRHGGNLGMASWSYIGFTGARASFKEWVDKHDVPYPLGPVSINGERA